MDSLLSVLFSNVLRYDWIIFVAAVLDAVCYALARRRSKALDARIHMVVYVPSRNRDPESVAKAVSAVNEERIIEERRQSERPYTFFLNITAIFPLLGILGTVLSLIPMVSDMSSIQDNFFAALTSTFWGLVFAILFKFLDSFLAPRVEENERGVALMLERRKDPDEKERRG